ncbi:cytochrome P450 [Nocardiopsis sp. B62]|uniref:cytochrome P450 family protein n=1 Tax=Nocardiopsis sp. B62 TaxID=2824874 RepID=UPI001B375968|nr:cytochrome P450 [Nocardiopsis sp. B62]MBQ1080598.1 cytochrome P450 [Nocardiopsis sp. B62]
MRPNGAIVIDPTGADIHEEAERIRVLGPIARIELPGGVRAWSVTGYEAARQVLADTRFSKDPRKHWTAFSDGTLDPAFPLIGWAMMENLTTSHGEDHARLRRLVTGAFTTRRVERLRPEIERTVDRLLDALESESGDAPVDLRSGFAEPLALNVICELLGVPQDVRAVLFSGGEANVDTTNTSQETASVIERVHGIAGELIESRREQPGNDLVSDLIRARDEDGSRLSEAELMGTILLLVSTGTEPVKNLLTNTISELLGSPGSLAAALEGRTPWGDTVEETLRVQAPVAHLPFRFAVEDVEVAGTVVPRGEPVLIHYAAVGRDPAIHHRDPDVFDPDRADKRHLSFGHGVYRCVGMPLARLEAEVALSSLFRRFPELRLAVPASRLERQSTFIMNGLSSLPVRLGKKVTE